MRAHGAQLGGVLALLTEPGRAISGCMNIRQEASVSSPDLSATAIFRALSDPTRLRIVHLLRDGPLCVGDLVTVLDVPQPTASRHLAYLRRVGLVDQERRGTWIFYGLVGPYDPFHVKLLECVAAAHDMLAPTRADDLALRALRRKGGCCPQHEHPKRGGRNA